MWTVRVEDVKNIGRTPGGDHFTEFVNSLIRGWSHLHGLPCSEIFDNQRTNKQDGGVDTEVCRSILNDPLGWMGNPTIWQYKATDSSEVSESKLVTEIKKWYVVECINQGYAYRFCICDSIPSYMKKSWEDILNREIKRINANAPNAKVLTAEDLAQWASRLPAINLRYFHPRIATLGLHFEAWGKSITEITPEFVRYPAIDGIINEIQNHVNFGIIAPNVVLPVSGLSGVGKTRLVYESLLLCDGTKSLVIFTNDEYKAVEIAMTISNNSMINAILVADECGLNGRLRLIDLLRGHKDRVRVITIDNSGVRPDTGSPELWIEKMPPEIVDEILVKNYPGVPIGRRRAYTDLSKGFVRFAADLCRNDNMIASSGCVDPALRDIREYLRKRFSSEELKVIQALSLVKKIGYLGDVSHELSALCETVNLEPENFKEIATRIHNGPGFISKAGRYLYVTPEIIAQTGFDLAWNNWISDDPESFLKKLPKILLESFYLRTRESASEVVRTTIGDFFRKWSFELRHSQLNSVEAVNRLITLIEVEPRIYLPVLRNLIEQSTLEELKSISGKNRDGNYGPRRSIVWLAERIAAFPEYFDDAENILLRLGLAESEKNIGNNATAIWRQLYRIALSGTAVPFLARLNRLELRILSYEDETSHFAIGALDGILNDHAMRRAGPSIVAGKIPPEEYVPNTNDEYIKCISETFKLLRRIINHASIPDDIKRSAKYTVVDNTRTLLNLGLADELQVTLSERNIDNDLRAKLIENIETFLHFDIKAKWGRPALADDYVKKVDMYLANLKPSDVGGRISIVVGTCRGHYSILGNEDKLESEVESLAKEFLEHPENLKQEIETLFSPDAKNASSFGYGLGKLDKNAIFLDFIIESSIKYNSTEFGRGYLSGILDSYPSHADFINKKFDEIQMEYPVLAYELFMTRIELTNALERALKLVDLGKLGPIYLGRFIYGKGEHQLSQNSFRNILQRLVGAAIKGDAPSIKAALEFISFRIFSEKEGKIGQILDQDDIRSLAWRLIEITPKKAKSYEWTQIIEALSKYDPDRAAKLAVLGLAEGDLLQLGDFISFFTSLAKMHPELVMQRLGEVMLDEEKGWIFYTYKFSPFFKAIPDESIIKWVKDHGVEGARRLANHLPAPYVSDNGDAIVPNITQFILDNYGDDDRVFNQFALGMHSFQLYSGDIASQHDREAEIARTFLSHPSERIRKWAQMEEENAISEAKRWRQFEEERQLD